MSGIYNPGASSIVPGATSFAQDGASTPWGISVPSKPALYASSTSATWFCWEAWSPSLAKRVVEVTTYIPGTGWSPTVVAGTQTLTNDVHGTPDMVRDPTRKHVYIFYGAHNGNVQYSYTTNPDDPSAWSTGSLLSATYGLFTFPSAFVQGSTLYLFYSPPGTGGGNQQSVSVTTATINADGSLTFSGTTKSLLDISSGAAGWFFPGQYIQQNGKIYITGNYSSAVGTFPLANNYVLVYDPATGNVSNFDASFTVVPASQPINKTTLDAHFIAVSDSTIENATNIGFDNSGAAYITWVTQPASTMLLKYSKNSGAGWSAAATIFTAQGSNPITNAAIVPMSDGSIDFYYGDGSFITSTYAAGAGDIYSVNLVGSTLGAATLVARHSYYGIGVPTIVTAASSTARVIFAEASSDGLTVAGNLRGYAYGDSGFVPLSNAVLEPPEAPLGTDGSIESVSQGTLGVFSTSRGDAAWRVPQVFYANGTDPSPFGSQAFYQYDNNGTMRSVMYSDGTQYWSVYSSGSNVGIVEVGAPGSAPGIMIENTAQNQRVQWTWDTTNHISNWGAKATSGAANNQLSLRAADGGVTLQSGGYFGFANSSTNSAGTVDAQISRDSNGNLKLTGNTGTLLWWDETLLNLRIGSHGEGGSITTGVSNVFIGDAAGAGQTDGSRNFAIGSSCQFWLAHGSDNVAIGYNAGTSGTGSPTTCNADVAIGYLSLQTSQNGFNVCVGYLSGSAVTSGFGNVVLGAFQVGNTGPTTGSQNILIGCSTQLASQTASGQLSIGNYIYGTGLTGTGATISSGAIGIGTKAPACELDVAGAIKTAVVAVASLPAAGTAGRRYFVNNANATTFASIVAGGGANFVPVYDDGTNWRIG